MGREFNCESLGAFWSSRKYANSEKKGGLVEKQFLVSGIEGEKMKRVFCVMSQKKNKINLSYHSAQM